MHSRHKSHPNTISLLFLDSVPYWLLSCDMQTALPNNQTQSKLCKKLLSRSVLVNVQKPYQSLLSPKFSKYKVFRKTFFFLHWFFSLPIIIIIKGHWCSAFLLMKVTPVTVQIVSHCLSVGESILTN